MYCTVIEIRGDYALIKYNESQVTSEIALALLPHDINIGDCLLFENYEFTHT